MISIWPRTTEIMIHTILNSLKWARNTNWNRQLGMCLSYQRSITSMDTTNHFNIVDNIISLLKYVLVLVLTMGWWAIFRLLFEVKLSLFLWDMLLLGNLFEYLLYSKPVKLLEALDFNKLSFECVLETSSCWKITVRIRVVFVDSTDINLFMIYYYTIGVYFFV